MADNLETREFPSLYHMPQRSEGASRYDDVITVVAYLEGHIRQLRVCIECSYSLQDSRYNRELYNQERCVVFMITTH